MKVRFSLILPTLNRNKEIVDFLNSLKNQIYKNFELIIIDQNETDELRNLIKIFDYKIIYIRSNKKGLSKNRNMGLKIASGEIISFPDDDCEYKQNTLELIDNFFIRNSNYQIYSCGVMDKKNGKKFPFLNKNSEITKNNLMKVGCSITFFILMKKNFNYSFDEKLGVGAEFGSGEETDFVSNLLNQGYKGYYISDNFINHPVKNIDYPKLRYYNYGLGFGALSKKEIIFRKNKRFIVVFLQQILKSILGIIMIKKSGKHFINLKGIIEGFYKYER